MKRTNRLVHGLTLLAVCTLTVPSYGHLTTPMQAEDMPAATAGTAPKAGGKSSTCQDAKCLEKIIARFVAYARINSQSTDTDDMDAFPLNEGQRLIAAHMEKELLAIGKGHDMTVKRSESEYLYAKIPSNVKRRVPSVMFMATSMSPRKPRAVTSVLLSTATMPAETSGCRQAWCSARNLRKGNT